MTNVKTHVSWFDHVMAIPLAAYLIVVVSLVVAIFISITGPSLKEAFSETAVIRAVWLSLSTSLASTSLSILIAVPAGYILSRHNFPGKTLFDTVLDLPIVLPPLVMGLSVLIFFNTVPGRFIENIMEFVYTWRGIILVQFIVGCAFCVRVIKAAFDGMNYEYENVAMILGAARAQTFFKVTLPLARQGIVAGAVIGWARIFGLFGPILLVSGTMRNRTEIMPTTIFLETSIGRIEVALVIATLMIMISLSTLVLFRLLGGKGYMW